MISEGVSSFTAPSYRSADILASGQPIEPLGNLVTMKTLGERLSWAMAGGDGFPRVTQVELAKACSVSQSVISDWKTGDSQSMRASYLYPAAKRLQVDPEWLATGKGEPRPASLPSHAAGLSPAILSESLKWLDFLEESTGKLGFSHRGQRLSMIYARLVADGGQASPHTAAEFIDGARERPPTEGEQDEKRSTAKRRR